MSDLLDLLNTIQASLRTGSNHRERRTFTPGATQSTVEALEDEIRALREELGMVREHLRVEKGAAARALDTARDLRCELNSRLQALKRSEIEIASLTQALATARAQNESMAKIGNGLLTRAQKAEEERDEARKALDEAGVPDGWADKVPTVREFMCGQSPTYRPLGLAERVRLFGKWVPLGRPDLEEAIERAFWEFDAKRKASSERDAFKAQARGLVARAKRFG